MFAGDVEVVVDEPEHLPAVARAGNGLPLASDRASGNGVSVAAGGTSGGAVEQPR